MTPKRKAPATAFKPGQSGNPRGRPKGALNQTTRVLMALMESEAREITRTVIELAKGGELTAARLILERLVPAARERTISLPDLPDTRTATGIAEAQHVVLSAVASGTITPGEGATLSGILEARRKVIETVELELRVATLENKT